MRFSLRHVVMLVLLGAWALVGLEGADHLALQTGHWTAAGLMAGVWAAVGMTVFAEVWASDELDPADPTLQDPSGQEDDDG